MSMQERDKRQIRRQEDGLPEFIVRCVRKIDPMVSTVGIYRINGDAAAVQKIRYLFKPYNYKSLKRKSIKDNI